MLRNYWAIQYAVFFPNTPGADQALLPVCADSGMVHES